MRPLADPRRVAVARPESRRASRVGSGPAEAAPSPEARIGAEARPVALSKNAGQKPSRFSRNLPRPKPVEIPFGSRLRPKASPLSRSLSQRPKPLRRTPFRVAAGAEALPRSPAGSGPGAIPAAFAGSAGFSGSRKSLHRLAMGGFVKSRLASACAYAGAASSASLAFPLRVPASLGGDGAFGLGPRPSVRRAVSGPPNFPATSETCQLHRFRRKANSACG